MKTYDWHDGHGKVHSRPKKNGGGKPAKPKPTGLEYLNAPQTTQQIGAQADQMAGLQYGGQEQALTQRQQSVAPFFQNYMNTIQGAVQQNQQLVQPMVDQARTAATNSGATVLDKQGVDPSSEAAQNDVLAAAGRKALGDAAATQLASILGAGQTFLGNQQAIAPMYQQQVTQQIGQQQSQLQAEKGAYRASTYGDLQKGERQYGLDLRHQGVEDAAFNVDTQNTLADNEQQAATPNKWGFTAQEWSSFTPAKRQRIMKRQAGFGQSPAKPGDHYGFTDAEWAGMSHAQKVKAKGQWQASGRAGGSSGSGKDGLTPAQRRAARKERNTAVQRVADVQRLWDPYRAETVPESKDASGDIIGPHRPSNAEVRARLQREKYTPAEINLALAIRHKKLMPADVRTAKRLGIWPLPKQWRGFVVPKQPKPTGGKPSGGAVGYPYGTGAGSVH